MDYSSIIRADEYDFLNTNEHFGKHIILLGLAGSYSYGTNNENSDIDIHGKIYTAGIMTNLISYVILF